MRESEQKNGERKNRRGEDDQCLLFSVSIFIIKVGYKGYESRLV